MRITLFFLSVVWSVYLSECYEGYLRDIDPDWEKFSGHMNQPKCIDIPSNLTLCRHISYNQMRLPNLLGHDTINEVIQQAKSWVSLLGVHCHPDTQLFLCSLFSPVCLDRPIFPCRSLCEKVKAGCEQTMMFYGYNWPDMVKCDKFPLDSDLCIQPLHHNSSLAENICSACRQPDTYEGLIHNYCRAGYVVRAKIRKVTNQNDNTLLYLKKKKKVYKRDFLSKRDKKRLKPYIPGGLHCECDRINVTSGNKYLIMGNKTATGQYTVTFVGVWNRKDKNFRRAIKHMRKGIDCSNIMMHGHDAGAISTGGGRSTGRGGKKGGKGKKKGRNNKGKGRNRNKKNRNKGKKKKNRKGKKGKRKGKGRKGRGRKRKGSTNATLSVQV